MPSASMDSKRELLDILRCHDVDRFQKFIATHPKQFEGVTKEQRRDDKYIFDLLHVYKANLFYMGKQYFESMNYCLERGLIKLSPEMEVLFTQAKNNQEIEECAITQELVQDKHQLGFKD